MAKQPKQLEDLFFDGLKDIYFAEKKILVALPKMAKAAGSDELRAAFEKHHAETEGQISRLEEVFGLMDEDPKGKNCPAILGLVEEGKEIMEDYKGSPALDAGLLSAAQAVEHYEISHADRVGRGTRAFGGGASPPKDAGGGEGYGRGLNPAGRGGHQPGS